MILRRARRAGVVAAALLLALTSCAASPDETGSPATVSSSGPVAEAALVGPNLDLLGQGPLEGKDVVVWFWANW